MDLLRFFNVNVGKLAQHFQPTSQISHRKLGKNPSVFTTAELQKTKKNKRKQQETDVNTLNIRETLYNNTQRYLLRLIRFS